MKTAQNKGNTERPVLSLYLLEIFIFIFFLSEIFVLGNKIKPGWLPLESNVLKEHYNL